MLSKVEGLLWEGCEGEWGKAVSPVSAPPPKRSHGKSCWCGGCTPHLLPLGLARDGPGGTPTHSTKRFPFGPLANFQWFDTWLWDFCFRLDVLWLLANAIGNKRGTVKCQKLERVSSLPPFWFCANVNHVDDLSPDSDIHSNVYVVNRERESTVGS